MKTNENKFEMLQQHPKHQQNQQKYPSNILQGMYFPWIVRDHKELLPYESIVGDRHPFTTAKSNLFLNHNQYLVRHLTPAVLSGRISEFARIHSLAIIPINNSSTIPYLGQNHSKSHSDHTISTTSNPSIQCSSANGIVMDVTLWRYDGIPIHESNNAISNDEDIKRGKRKRANNHIRTADWSGIVLEVRRRKGEAVEFHRLKSTLLRRVLVLGYERGRDRSMDRKLREIEGFHDTHNHDISLKKVKVDSSNHDCTIPLQPQAKLSTAHSINHPKISLNDLGGIIQCISTACTLLKRSGTKEAWTGLKTLSSLTDSSKNDIHPTLQINAVLMLLTGLDPFGKKLNVKDLFFTYIIKRHYNDTLRQLALQVLGDSLNILQNKNKKISLEEDDDTLISSLMLDMENVCTNPHLATRASRCLRYLFQTNIHINDCIQFKKEKLKSIIEQMWWYGRNLYQNLEIEVISILLVIKDKMYESNQEPLQSISYNIFN